VRDPSQAQDDNLYKRCFPVRENSIIYNSKYAIAQLIKKHLSNKYTNSLCYHPEPAKKLTKDLKKTLKA
jgi:hypothetical protein